jgi:hypothetical protein
VASSAVSLASSTPVKTFGILLLGAGIALAVWLIDGDDVRDWFRRG